MELRCDYLKNIKYHDHGLMLTFWITSEQRLKRVKWRATSHHLNVSLTLLMSKIILHLKLLKMIPIQHLPHPTWQCLHLKNWEDPREVQSSVNMTSKKKFASKESCCNQIQKLRVNAKWKRKREKKGAYDAILQDMKQTFSLPEDTKITQVTVCSRL